jgi:hypothetical protein
MDKKIFKISGKSAEYSILDPDGNSILEMKFDSTYSYNATFVLEGNTYTIKSNAMCSRYILTLGEEQLAEMNMEMAGNIIVRLKNNEKMMKLFEFKGKGMLNHVLQMTDFLTNLLYSIKDDISWKGTKSSIVEEDGWLEEDNNINRNLLLAITCYLNIIYKLMMQSVMVTQ